MILNNNRFYVIKYIIRLYLNSSLKIYCIPTNQSPIIFEYIQNFYEYYVLDLK